MELLPFFDLYGITLTCVWGGFGERYLLRQIKSFILYGIRPSYLQCIAYLIFHKKKKISKFVGGEIPFSFKNNILYYMELAPIFYNVLLILIFNNGDCKAIISVWFTTGYVIE